MENVTEVKRTECDEGELCCGNVYGKTYRLGEKMRKTRGKVLNSR